RAWSHLAFDEGLDLLVTEESQLSLLEFVIQQGTHEEQIVAQLPPSYNPVISVQDNGTSSPIFQTQFPHALDLRGSYDWGETIKLISTPITDPSIYELTINNVSLEIISDTEFRLNLTSPITFTAFDGSVYGYVKAPKIPNPSILAKLITDSLGLVAPR